MVPRHDLVHLQGPLVFVHPAALAAAFGPGEHPVLHRAAHQVVGAIAVGGDAVEGKPGPPFASQDSTGYVLRGCWDPFWLCRPSRLTRLYFCLYV